MREKELEIAGGSLCYVAEPDRVRITQFKGNGTQVTVPEIIEGLPVTEVGKKCFMGKRSLARVFLPDTVESIGDFCFAGDGSLQQVSVPDRKIVLGKTPFWNCGNLKRIEIRREGESREAPAELLALAAVEFGSYYLLDMEEAGSEEWYRKWDSRLAIELHTPDMEGHTHTVLCGEEDYESIDLEGYMSGKRTIKSRHCLTRLVYCDRLENGFREELESYLREHTKGAESEESWQVILKEFGENKAYYSLFAEIGCVTPENLDGILEDIGENLPEMKAYFLRYKAETSGAEDFFAGLEL